MNASIVGELERPNRDRGCNTGKAWLLVTVFVPRLPELQCMQSIRQCREQKVRSQLFSCFLGKMLAFSHCCLLSTAQSCPSRPKQFLYCLILFEISADISIHKRIAPIGRLYSLARSRSPIMLVTLELQDFNEPSDQSHSAPTVLGTPSTRRPSGSLKSFSTLARSN